MRLLVQLIAAIGFAGLGHYFVAFQRDVYPADGYAFYVVAAALFLLALRSARGWPESDWSALRDPLAQIADALRRLAGVFLNIGFGPTLFLSLIVLNLISAVLAVLISSWIVFAGWIVSVIWLVAIVLPRPVRRAARAADLPPTLDMIVEAPATQARSPRAAWIIVGVLGVVLGQLVINADQPGGSFGGIADSIADNLQLQIPGGGSALAGLALLALAAVVFGAATRKVALADRPPLAVDVRQGRRTGWGGRWLVVAAAGLVLWFWVARAVADGATGLGPPALWAAALILLGAVWRKIDRDRGVRLGVSLDRREAIGLALMLIGALAIGLFQLGRLPASIWGDEGAYWTLARDLAAGVAPVNVFGMGTYSFPMGGSVYQSLWISLFGPTVGAWRLGSVLALVASMVPLYFVARGLLGRRVAFVALAFFATSPFALAFGRIGYLYALPILPVTASAALIVTAVRRDSRLYAYLSGLAGGIGFMVYPSAQFGITLCALILIGFAITRAARGTSILRLGLSFVSAAILAAGPALVFGAVREPAALFDKTFQSSMASVLFAEPLIGHDELLARASFFSTRDNQLFFEPSMYAGLALRGWVRTAIGLHRSDLYAEQYIAGPLAGPLTLLYVLGLGWCLARWRRPGYGIWPIWLFAGTFLFSAIESFPPHVTDLLPIVPALAVLAAIGLVGLLDSVFVGRALRFRPAWLKDGALVVVAAAIGVLGVYAYFVEMPQRYKPALDMAMFWSALDLSRGSMIVFVRDEAYAPDFMPWGMQNFDTGVGWTMVELADLARTDLHSVCQIDCRIFYTPPYADAVESLIRAEAGDGTLTAYTNAAGDAIGYSFAPSRHP